MFIRERGTWVRFGIVVFGVLFSMYSSGLAQTATETSDLSVTSVRKALAGEHAAITARPKDPKNYIDLAYTLTDAGIEDQARTAAADATRVAPASAFTFSAQGWVLHHNSIGVDYGSGFDYDGAVRAYWRAIELDPQDLDVRQSLANLLEFNHEGVRYAPDAQLSLAIEAYRYVKQHQRIPEADVVKNLAIDLFYAGRYGEALAELAPFTPTPEHLGIILASVAASKGSSASIELSNSIGGDEQRRKDALNFAAEGLWNKRLYPQAADLLTASLPDTSSGAISAKIQIFRNLKPFTPANLPASDPRSPVQRLLETTFMRTLNEDTLKELLSRHSFATDAAWKKALLPNNALTEGLLALMKRTGLPRVVVADLVLSRMSITTLPNPGSGTPVRVQVIGLSPMQYFVVSENGTWKMAASGRSGREVGAQALYLLTSGRPEVARPLLDWYYSLLEPSKDEGDPLSGDLFVRLWAPSARAAAEAPTFAAAALTDDATLLLPLVSEIVRAREAMPAGTDRTSLDLLLAAMYLRLQDASNAHLITSRLLQQNPESHVALQLAGQAYARQHDWAAWKALLAKRLQKEPDNRQLLLESAAEASAEGDYPRARQAYQSILDGSHATSADYTMYGWLSLFAAKPDDKALAAAQQATINANGRNYQSLLTAACLDASRGNTAEAHQELLDAMSSAGLTQPDAGVWYGFGRIFEQYGVMDAAVSSYRRTVQMTDSVDKRSLYPGEVDASALARVRLKALSTERMLLPQL